MADVSHLGFPAAVKYTGGAGLTYEEGKISALGELVERYCSGCVDRKRLLYGSYRELSREHELVHPERFALYSAAQYERPNFPFARFTEDSVLSWVQGYSLVQRREVWVPASRVYLPYAKTQPETELGVGISTGLAAGPTLERAILSGLYECIERDSFTIFWMNDLPVRQVDVPGSAPSTRTRAVYDSILNVPRHEYFAYDITTDLGVSSAFTILRGPSPDGLVYAVGAAARLDGDKAVERSLVEAVQGKPYVLSLVKKDPAWKAAPDYANVRDFGDHCKLYTMETSLQPHLMSVQDRVLAVLPAEDLPAFHARTPLDEIEELTDRFSALGYEAVVVDVTTPDIESMGVKVVRVVTPELQQLHAMHRLPFLGGRRLYEVPHKLGYRERVGTEADLSPYPHPFP
jgi:ribosomal protein S12 methylthiotransferase accessory factor